MLTRHSPAKINLYLHMTGRRADGFHYLDSLVAFTTTGDVLEFSPSDHFDFEIKGTYASSFLAHDLLSSRDSRNLIVRSAHALSDALCKPLQVKITLTKNLPLGSGIGGGSSNAATCLSGLCEYWGTPMQDLPGLAIKLGSDIPVCLPPQRPTQMQGIGDITRPLTFPLPPLHILLVNPNIHCPTPQVYKAMRLSEFSGPITLPHFKDYNGLLSFLKKQTHNDMTAAAISLVPEIQPILDHVSAQKGCDLARLSGSGATVFGIFPDAPSCATARDLMATRYPDYWVEATETI